MQQMRLDAAVLGISCLETLALTVVRRGGERPDNELLAVERLHEGILLDAIHPDNATHQEGTLLDVKLLDAGQQEGTQSGTETAKPRFKEIGKLKDVGMTVTSLILE